MCKRSLTRRLTQGLDQPISFTSGFQLHWVLRMGGISRQSGDGRGKTRAFVIKWLRIHLPIQATYSIPGWGTKIPHALEQPAATEPGHSGVQEPQVKESLPATTETHHSLINVGTFFRTLLNSLWWPLWEKYLQKNGYMCIYSWITLLYTRNWHNIVKQLYSNTN